MSEAKICRLCMGKDNLTSVWGKADGEKINEKINFLCGIIITSLDPLPKFVCHLCLSQLIIGASIKRKSLQTEKTLNDLLDDDIVELNDDNEDSAQDDPFYSEPKELRNKFLIYEENTEDEDQPKINYEISEGTIRMKNSKHIDNPDLKSFLDGYLAARPNMEIIKVTNPENIKEIEKVIDANNELKRHRKRPRNDLVISSVHSNMAYNSRQHKPSKEIFQSRLLSALAGQRLGNINISRMSSPLFNNNNANRNN